jgi:hypothetical protein
MLGKNGWRPWWRLFAPYENAYELANHPDWLRVPLAGTLRILNGPRKAETAEIGAKS